MRLPFSSRNRSMLPDSLVLAACVLMGLVTAGRAQAQELDRPLSAEASLEDFGIARADFVLRGRVVVDWLPGGPRLGVRWLRDVPAPDHPAVLPPRTEDTATGRAGEAPQARSGARTEPRRALWVWNTQQILGDADARDRFLTFVESRKVDRVFLDLPPAEGRRADAGFVPFDGDRIGPLLSSLSERGVRVDALDGDPDYVLRPNHAGVVRTIERIAAYNAAAPPSARFHGVHYDVEPYLVRGYQGPAREEILESYLDLVDEIARAARAGGLSVGLDVPFWFDAPDEESGEIPEAIHEGTRRPILAHLLATVDEITVMDYRTATGGSDGSVAQARGELEAAASAGVRVWIGLETGPIADEDLYTFGPRPSSAEPRAGDSRPWIALEPMGAGRVKVWLVPAGKVVAFREKVTHDGVDPRTLLYWPAGRAIRVPGDKLSFHRLGWSSLQEATGRIVDKLGSLPAFAGVAYHDYVNWSALVGKG